jgi:hypothetical protein
MALIAVTFAVSLIAAVALDFVLGRLERGNGPWARTIRELKRQEAEEHGR